MKTLMSLLSAMMICALFSVSAIGCNTFRGAGKDIQQGGKTVENAAEGAQK